MNNFGFVRVTAASHRTHVADPVRNAIEACRAIDMFAASDVIVLGELSLTGYTCADLFAQDALLQSTIDALVKVTNHTEARGQLVIVGLPIRVGGRLFNAAAALSNGKVLGIVPKQYLPNYQEFYEARWFAAADGGERNRSILENWG